jgi:NADH-quinone oxidoreductase subunit J
MTIDLGDATFFGLAIVTIGGAMTALEAREIVYGAIGLAFSFFGVAGLFFLLDAAFVAVFQITVYVGAVAVLILFTVMLVREGRWMRDSPPTAGKIAGVFTAVALAVSLLLTFAASGFIRSLVQQPNSPTLVDIGRLVSGSYAPMMEVLALVLAAAVLGAIMLAKVERGERAK